MDFKIVAPDGLEFKLSELVVIRDVCETFGVTSMTVYNWIGPQNPETGYYDTGKFPHAFKLGNGGGIYIPLIDFNDFVKSKNQDIRKKVNKNGKERVKSS